MFSIQILEVHSLSVVLPHLTPLRHECILSAFGKKTYGIMKHEHA